MKIAVIGGGASGLTAAIAAARNGAKVTVFERNDKVGKKILVTGNGKCNISNTSLSEEYYYSEDRDFIVSSFDRFGLNDTIRFFKGLGLMLTEKRGGIYPYSEQASSVLDALRFEVDSLGVKVLLNSYVKEITPDGARYKISYEYSIKEENTNSKNKKNAKLTSVSVENRQEVFDKVIISTGGKAAPKTGSDGNGYSLIRKLGHKVTCVNPALGGLRCSGDSWKAISGVRCSANVSVIVNGELIVSEQGELQLTDYGVSGIPVFQVSRVASKALSDKKSVSVKIDFMPELSKEELVQEAEFRLLLLSDRTKEQFFNGIFNKKLTQFFLKEAKLDFNKCIEKKDIEIISAIAKEFTVDVIGDNGYEQAQVTAGGVPLSEINENFESVINKGMYIIGELLDVDGKCGGYNLQWAWTSGYIAGEAASKC